MSQPVQEVEARIKLQRQLIAELRADSELTGLAEELLATLEAMQIPYEAQSEELEGQFFSKPPATWEPSSDR